MLTVLSLVALLASPPAHHGYAHCGDPGVACNARETRDTYETDHHEPLTAPDGTPIRLAIANDPSMLMVGPAVLAADPTPALTPVPVPTSDSDAEALFPSIIAAFAQGKPGYVIGAGFALLLLIYALKAYAFPSLKIPPGATPWIAIALGVLAGAASALASGKAIVPALLAGLVAGLAAIGKHETAGRLVIPDTTGGP